MKNNIEQTAENLFDKLRNRFSPIEIKDENQKSTLDPKDARYFIFDYVDLSTGNSFGNITISIAGNDLEFIYTKDITASMSDQEKTQWYKFLKNLRFFAMRELGAKKESGTFDVRDISKSGLQLKDLKHISTKSGMISKDEVSMSESKLYGSKHRSYQKLDDVKIIAKHNKPIVDETIPGIRSRNVESFFIENSVGERFKLPEGTSINGARAYARHIKNGGQIFDDFGNHIGKIIKEMNDLRIFVRNMRGKTFEDLSTQQMVETAIDHYGKLHSDLFSLRHQRGYEQYKELWTPEVLEEENFDLNELKERFVKKIFDERLMNALPIVYREYSKKRIATEQEFESWANDVIAEYAKHPTDYMNKQDANHAEDIEEDQIDVNVKGPFSNSLRSVQRDSEDNAIDDDKENQSLAGVFRGQGFQFRFQDGIYYFESKEEIERAKDWIAYKFPKMKFPKMGVFDYGYGLHGSTTFDRELPGGKGVMEEVTNENLRKWFKEKWVRFGPDGKIRGQCARDDDSEGKPKCLPQAKAYALGKKKRATSAARKRREDPNPERKGTAKNVKTESDHNMNKDFGKFKLSAINEGDVIRTKFSTKQSQKAKDTYQKQTDVADDIPVYDPKTGRSVLPKFAKGHEVPFQKFIARSVSDRVTRILGITDDGKQIAVSTFGAPIEFVDPFVDALNRGGFSKVPIQKVPLGNMFKEEQAHGSPADRGSADAWYGRRARPHKVVDGQHIDITDRQDPEYQEYMNAYNKTRNDPMMRDVIDENEKGVTAEQLNIGDEVIITGPVKFNGATGVIADFGLNKSFVVVDLYNYGKKSFHSSDVEENLYAGSEEEDEEIGGSDFDDYDDEDVREARHFRTAYGWAGGSKPSGGRYKHPDQIKADREAKKKEKQALADKEKSKDTDDNGLPSKGVKEGYWADAVSAAEKSRAKRAGKPFEKNPASHDEKGIYKGDLDLAGNIVPKKVGDTVTYTKGGKTYKSQIVKIEPKNNDVRYHLKNAGLVYHSDLEPEQNVSEGLLSRLAAAGALVTGLGMAGYYLDRTAPKVSIQGNMAYVVPEDHGKVPPNALTLKGDDGVTYRVWMSKRKDVFAYPIKNVQRTDEQGVAEGSLNEGQYEMMMRNGQVKKFVAKDDADAKRIAKGHGAKSVIRLKGGVPAGKVSEQGVAEGKPAGALSEMDKSAPQPGRDGKVSHITYGSRDKKGSDYFKGKEALSKPITKKQMEKHALDILKKQGVAEGLDYEREPLYHATLKAFEPSIMKSGLLPGGNLRMFDWSDSKFVYLSNYPDIARDFIDPGVIEPDEEHEEQIFDLMKQGGVILKIDQNKLNRQLLSADPHFNTDADDGAETYIYSGVIPPSAIIGKQYFNINESKQGVAEGADWVTKADRAIATAKKAHKENPSSGTKAALSAAYAAKRKKQAEWATRKDKPTFSDKKWSPYNESQDMTEAADGLSGAKLYNSIGKILKSMPALKFRSRESDAGSFKAWFDRVSKVDISALLQQLKSLDPSAGFTKATSDEPWSIIGANFRLDGPDQNYRGDSGVFLEVYRAGPGGKLRRAGSDEPVTEANKKSLLGKFQRGRELSKKVAGTWDAAAQAEKAGDPKTADKMFKKHVRYTNLAHPGTWKKVKDEQGMAEAASAQSIDYAVWSKKSPQDQARLLKDYPNLKIKNKPQERLEPVSKPKKLTLDDVWRKVEAVVSQIYPDGDPIEWMIPWLAKHGIRDYRVGEILDRAARKNGYKNLYDYYNSMGGLYGDQKYMTETSDYFRRREREEAIISGKKPPRKKQPAQTSDYAKRRAQEKAKEQGIAEAASAQTIDYANRNKSNNKNLLSNINEKKDACYSKVKNRYKVWPSAYASGALVQCRKKGAKNWGKESTNESHIHKLIDTFKLNLSKY